MKKVNIGLKDKVHMQAKIVAVAKGVSMNEYIEQAIESALENDKKIIKDLGK